MAPVPHPVGKGKATKQARPKYKLSVDGTTHTGVLGAASSRVKLTHESGHEDLRDKKARAKKQGSGMFEEPIRL